MGFLSSWPVMALTHHAVVQQAAYRVYGSNILHFQDYILLGDDIVIFDRWVADSYKQLMNMYGVAINSTKSIIGSGYGEFCKRLIRYGEEVTPLPSKVLKAVRDYPVTAPYVFESLTRRFQLDLTVGQIMCMVPWKSVTSCARTLTSPLLNQDQT